jgi:hypothetical protein
MRDAAVFVSLSSPDISVIGVLRSPRSFEGASGL